jgi:hypothetical protein
MAIVKSKPEQTIINGQQVMVSDKVVISEHTYTTNGESLIIVKDVDKCEILLESTTTEHIIIKTLTKCLIKTTQGHIDEEYEEILIDKGACVEFYFALGNWYIVSSDGLKMS